MDSLSLRSAGCLPDPHGWESPAWKSMNETIPPSVDGISAREIIMQRLAQIRARMDAADSRKNSP
jgi:hypothetical protein